MQRELAQCFEERRIGGNRNSDESLYLRGGNENRRACTKADDHRMRNEIDQSAQSSDAHHELEEAGQKRDGKNEAYVIRASDRCHLTEAGKEQDRHGVSWSGNHVKAGAEQRRERRWDHGGIQTILRRQTGQDGEGNALRQSQHRARESRDEIGTGRAPVDKRPPAQEGQQLA